MSERPVAPITYLLVFAALLALTGLTTGIAYVPLGRWSDPIALAIAVTKAALVVLFFMHALHSEALVKSTIAVSIIWIVMLIGLTMSDVTTRDWVPGRTLAPATATEG